MGLSKLIEVAGVTASRTGTSNISAVIDNDVLAMLDEMAEEIGVTRSRAIRECLREGVLKVAGEWESAKEEGARQKAAAKAAKSPKGSK